MEFLSSLYSSTIIPQGSHKLLKRYIRGKKFDSPDGKKVVRQGLLYLFIKGLLATSTPAGSRTLNLASSDRSLYPLSYGNRSLVVLIYLEI